ncbi:MAG TPA: hypothetical protein VIM48_07350, partial [Chthoniobacterales bacterium]
MNTPDLERLLASTQPRRLPPAWKADILDAAQHTRRSRPLPLLRIERAGWAAIAAGWLIVLA